MRLAEIASEVGRLIVEVAECPQIDMVQRKAATATLRDLMLYLLEIEKCSRRLEP